MYLYILVIVALFFAFPFFCQAQETAKPSFFRSEGNRDKSGYVQKGKAYPLLYVGIGYSF